MRGWFHASAGEFRGALQAIASITKVEGAKGLFAGYGSFLLRDLPFDAIEFFAYEQLKKSYKASLSVKREPNSLETSAIGRTVRLQEPPLILSDLSQPGHSNSVGPQQAWKKLFALVITETDPSSLLHNKINTPATSVKLPWRLECPSQQLNNTCEWLAAGAIAGAFTGVVTTPLDVIKTRLMIQGNSRTYTGVVDCAQKIWAQEGSAAFLKVRCPLLPLHPVPCALP